AGIASSRGALPGAERAARGAVLAAPVAGGHGGRRPAVPPSPRGRGGVSPAGRGAGGGERSGCDRFRVVIVAAHPDPASFNAALVTAAAEAARRLGGDVRVHDLYRDGFDPRLAVSELPSQPAAAGMPGTESVAAKHVRFADDLTSRYAHDLVGADVVIVVHPVWFFHVPA